MKHVPLKLVLLGVVATIIALSAPLAAQDASPQEPAPFKQANHRAAHIYFGVAKVDWDIRDTRVDGRSRPGNGAWTENTFTFIGSEFLVWTREAWIWRMGLEFGSQETTLHRPGQAPSALKDGAMANGRGSLLYDLQLAAPQAAGDTSYGLMPGLGVNTRVAIAEVFSGRASLLVDMGLQPQVSGYMELGFAGGFCRVSAGAYIDVIAGRDFAVKVVGDPTERHHLSSNDVGVLVGAEFALKGLGISAQAVLVSETTIRLGVGWAW